MKKLLRNLLGFCAVSILALPTMAANPEFLYLPGLNGQWPGTWANMNKLYPSSSNPNIYEGTFSNVTVAEFKITETGAWNNATTWGLAANASIELFSDQNYTATLSNSNGGNNIKCSNWKSGGTLKLSFNYTTKSLTITTPDQPTKSGYVYTPPAQAYVRGTINSWTGSDPYKLSLQSSKPNASGEYEYVGTIATLSGSFKLAENPTGDAWGNIDLGYGSSNGFTLNNKFALGNSGDISVQGSLSNVTLTLYYNPNGTSYLYGTSTSTGPTYPETVYIIGNVNGNGFALNTGIKQTSAKDGVYTFSDMKIAAADANSYGFFAFTSGDLSDWNTINGNRYVPTEQDKIIAAGDTQTIDFGVDRSWKILPGTYDFTLDLVKNTLNVTSKDTPVDPTPSTPVTLYIVGSGINGEAVWDYNDANKMTYNEADGVYTWTGTKLEGKFKFNNGAWDTGYNIGAGEKNTITVGTALEVINNSDSGDILIAEDYYVANPIVTLNLTAMTVTVQGTLTQVEKPYVPEVIYFKGSFDDWGAGVELKADGKGFYTGNVTVKAAESIEFKLDCGNEKWYGFANDQENVGLVDGQATVLKMDAAGGNWKLTGWDGGTIIATVDWNLKTLALTGTTQGDTEGINAIEMTNGAEVIYNLQGVRVSKDNLKKGIYIINGKKVMVK